MFESIRESFYGVQHRNRVIDISFFIGFWFGFQIGLPSEQT